MKFKNSSRFPLHLTPICGAATLALVGALALAPQPVTAQNDARAIINVQAGQTGKAINPNLMGVFFEDINYAADGGLYAELVQNRSFEYSPADRPEWNGLTAWELVQRGGGRGALAVETKDALNANNPHSVVLTVEKGGVGVGLSNAGFDGIAIKAGERYDFSVYARRVSAQIGRLIVALESPDGTVYASATLPAPAQKWTKSAATLVPTSSHADARLVVRTANAGTIALDMVSLFPQKTFRGHRNGLRADLAQTIADLQPKFVRFPGGCVAHGADLDNIYDWKETIGPVETRRAQPNLWGYHQTTGLGYFEYFQFCDDIGAAPLPVVAAGVSCQFRPGGQKCIPLANMGAYVQDVLDLVEWANGPATSEWGAKRAAAGHPKPFGLKYIGVGNEDAITPEFRQRFEMIRDALKTKYPAIEVIGTSGPFHSGDDFDKGWQFARQAALPLVDEHYYESPQWFLSNLNRYDSYDRAQPHIYLGEYASKGNAMFNALSEAAYLTGLERNADVVQFASYAPLLAKAGRTQWNPDLIYFDNNKIAPSVNYYVQQLFGRNAGDTYLPSTVELTLPAPKPKAVGAFVGTWNTQAEFENVRLQSGADSTLATASVAGKWENAGAWQVENGVYRQSGDAQPALYQVPNATISATASPNYTLTLRARKTGGNEGFLIGFGATDAKSYYWWNLGGWNNTEHAIQKTRNGGSTIVGQAVPGRIETNRWYDVKIVVDGARIQCFLDGRLVHDVQDNAKPVDEIMVTSAVRDSKSGDLILKVVNVTPHAVQSQINLGDLKNVQPVATRTVLSGDPQGLNALENSANIVPQTDEIRVGSTFSYDAPPHSLSVIRVKTRG